MLAAFADAACDRAARRDTFAGTVTLVNRVTGNVRCIKNANCDSTLEAALRQRLGPAGIKLLPEPKIVKLDYEQAASAFSSASFRQAVAEGGGEVLKIGIEACGTVETVEGQSWIMSGSTRLLLDGPGPFSAGAEMCLTGELRDQVTPPRLVPGRLDS